jgi:oxygen-independent coproporphyrinogen-3 oxidase
MEHAYRKLPPDYFQHKDGALYQFNNIEYLLSRLPATQVDDDAVRHAEAAGRDVSLYIGVPWCEKICSFCNFAYSTKADPTDHAVYLDDLRQDVSRFLAVGDTRVRSIYFGGGTPTYLAPHLLKRHLSQITQMPEVAAGSGITCEFSTSTIDSEKLDVMLAAGVTRVSTGFQSLDDDTRSRANLVGTGKEAIQAIDLVLERLPNFNVDVIYGHPYQSDEDWFNTVVALASRNVPSITLYRLELKERTTFRKIYSRQSDTLTEEGRARLHYFVARDVLELAGYEERPLGWWVKKQSLGANPNWLNYLGVWKNSTPYIGFGQGAFTVGTVYYWKNVAKRQAWQEKIRAGRLAASSISALPPQAVPLNQFMRHCRTTKSMLLSAIREDFERLGLMPALDQTIADCLEWGLMEASGEALVLTEAGESLIHWIYRDLVARACREIGLLDNPAKPIIPLQSAHGS